MVKVFIERKNGKIIEFYGKGHANYSEYGEDIVCAAISAVTQQTALGIIKYLKLKPKMEMKDGFLRINLRELQLSDQKRRELDILLETMELMLKEIKKEHPKHLKLIEKEEKHCLK